MNDIENRITELTVRARKIRLSISSRASENATTRPGKRLSSLVFYEDYRKMVLKVKLAVNKNRTPYPSENTLEPPDYCNRSLRKEPGILILKNAG